MPIITGISFEPPDWAPFLVLDQGKVVTFKLRTELLEAAVFDQFDKYRNDGLQSGLSLSAQNVDSLDKSGAKIHSRKYYTQGYSTRGLGLKRH